MTKVLFVEDDDDVRENLSFELRQTGLAVFEERLAETALESLDRRVPDVILLDVGMPPGEITGIELLARLREDPGWKRLPVVVLSGFGKHLNPDLMASLGVQAVLTKAEVTATDVAQRIDQALRS
jgi:CheY-like chemotaxis protein